MDEPEETAPRANGGAPGPLDQKSGQGPSTTEVRIAAVEAAVAAGLNGAAAGEAGEGATDTVEEPAVSAASAQVPELPDWTDPPTGQVPRVLLEEGAEETTGGLARGPLWRERADDWDDDLGFGPVDEAVEDTTAVAGRLDAASFEDPFELGELEAAMSGAPLPPPEQAGRLAQEGSHPMAPLEEGLLDADDAAWAAFVAGGGDLLAGEGPGGLDLGPAAPVAVPSGEAQVLVPVQPGRAGRRGRERARRQAAPGSRQQATRTADRPPAGASRAEEGRPSRRNPLVATATGIGVGAVAAACFLGGAVPALALVAFVATLAAGEAYGTLRRGGRRPATFVGLVSVPALIVGSYLFGARAVPVVVAAGFLVSAIWYLARAAEARTGRPGPRGAPAADLAATLLVMCWVGVLGSFAGLLLSPRLFPDRHGVAFLLAAVLLTVAHDVGSYAAGATLGRHRVLPTVSPNKSWEGLAGGTVLTFVVAVAVLTQVHPIDLGAALGLAALVCVLGPLGDLTESLVKRDLGVKDMGSLLPAHGGLFDRIDAMLMVLPAAYFLFKVAHLS